MNKLSGNKDKNDHDGVKFKIESPTIEIKKTVKQVKSILWIQLLNEENILLCIKYMNTYCTCTIKIMLYKIIAKPILSMTCI